MCDNCQKLQDTNQALLQENEGLTEEVSGLMSQVRQQARREQALKRMLNEVQNADPAAAEIQVVLDNWRHHCGHPKAKTPVGGKRWLVVKKALRDHTLDELLEAIEGLALVPYVGARGRKADGESNERFDDVEHALRDEATIQRFRSYRARAWKVSSWVLYDEWNKRRATSDMYARATMLAQERERAETA